MAPEWRRPVIGIGTDLVEVEQFRRALARTPRLAERVFTDVERADAGRRRDPTEMLAARFAANTLTHTHTLAQAVAVAL